MSNSVREFMSISKILFSFSGRIPRQTYWLALFGICTAFFFATFIVVGISDVIEGGNNSSGSSAIPLALFILMYLGLLWCNLAVTVKRWHDRGKSGSWVLINFVPIIGSFWSLIELGFLEGTQGPNEFDDSCALAEDDQVPSAPQIAGRQCVDCQQKIVSFIGAKLCAGCEEPIHTACYRKHVASAHGTPAHAAYS